MGLVFLPGDEELWHDSRIRMRDSRLTMLERAVAHRVGVCAYRKSMSPRWQCSSDKPCYFCQEVKELCE